MIYRIRQEKNLKNSIELKFSGLAALDVKSRYIFLIRLMRDASL